MMEYLQSQQPDDLLTKVYTFLRDKTPLGKVSWRTWMDLGGIVTAAAGGYRHDPRLGIGGLVVSLVPETFDFIVHVEVDGMTLFDAGAAFGKDMIADVLSIGAAYVIGLAFRARRDSRYT